MRVLALLPVVALGLLWGWAIRVYPDLPERIPIHFDGSGTPDRFAPRSPIQWFLMPGVVTLMVALLAYALPVWIRRLAARNASYLNVPRKQEFARLSPEARVRAIAPMVVLLRVVSLELLGLFGIILHGSSKVASEAWDSLPSVPLWLGVGLLLLTPFAFLRVGSAAVDRELRRAAE